MKTLFEIIECVKNDEPVDERELRSTIVVLDAMSTMDHLAFRDVDRSKNNHMAKNVYTDRLFRRWKIALNSQPENYLGPEGVPWSSAYQESRKRSLKLLEERER